jgi:hypothetical protein
VLLASSATLAGPAFVSGASVERDGNNASITILLACQVRYLTHTPGSSASTFRIQLESTNSCNGVSPMIANTQEYYLPARAAEVNLTSIDYDGTAFGNQVLTLSFSKNVFLSIDADAVSDRFRVAIDFDKPAPQRTSSRSVASKAAVSPAAAKQAVTGERATSSRVQRPEPQMPVFVVNLGSSLRPPATADSPDLVMAADHKVYFTTVQLDGKTWYRIRLGFFDSKASAAAQLEKVKQQYPTAWVDRANDAELSTHRPKTVAVARNTQSSVTAQPAAKSASQTSVKTRPPVSSEKLASLMSDGRAAMTEGELSRAVQIYTKVLQYPEHEYMPEAQEFLALARERNGQTAHAKAEYQRYLALYGDADGADRVRQRLAALVATSQTRSAATTGSVTRPMQRTTRQTSPWRVTTYLSQYYRRDVNQIGENDEVTSQSSLYSDINLDARRRGTRFDFGTRLSAGYRSDFLEESMGPGNQLRISYAYADLADSSWGLRARVGRQSRNNGGILGRFDGLNLGYQLTERTLLNFASGKPVNSASDGMDGPRSFTGVSANFGPIADNLDIGGFYIRQSVDGLSDREAVGTEIRYFDSKRSFWGLLDYDTSYKELGSAFLQGTWRFDSQFTINALVDRRHSPFLSTSNALIGQPFETLDSLAGAFTEQDIRQLSLDRSAITTTYTLGASYPISPRFQINGNVTQSSVSETPESGGVAATPASTYSYFGTNLVASSLIREGDVTILGVRYSQSVSTRITSLNIDTRFPITRSFYINPRLRIDRREILSDSSTEWVYSPGLRMRFRFSRAMRIQFEAGKQFANRDTVAINVDRESYFVNFGYQLFF